MLLEGNTVALLKDLLEDVICVRDVPFSGYFLSREEALFSCDLRVRNQVFFKEFQKTSYFF